MNCYLNFFVMILTTIPPLQRKNIVEYKGVVFGAVIAEANCFKDFTANLRIIIGGRSHHYEDELIQARQEAMEEMADRACRIGTNEVVGIDIDYEVLGEANGMLMVTESCVAVVTE